MGQTIENLKESKLQGDQIFPKRFVVEICEAVHVHYKNLRLLLSLEDWKAMATGMADSLRRWDERKCPEPAEGTHIELCRKVVGTQNLGGDSVKINLNKNLYSMNVGKIFAEGAQLEDPEYVHLKLWDLRLELTKDQYRTLRQAIIEAEL